MAKKLTKGVFITFEGPEGSGKSTQSNRLHEDLLSRGYDAVHTLEPGGTPLGGKIREILLGKEEIGLVKEAELFLFEADRAQHVQEVILPALEAGKVVICDRFNTATFAYQGAGLGMDIRIVEAVDRMSTGELCPDLTILLDVEVETGLKRAGAEHTPDRMEKRSRDFHQRVRQGYLDIAKKSPDRIKVIRVAEDINETYKLVKERVYALIERYKGSE
ncbi:MAG: dTMP kinase [Candidatus Omnitrophota bacterium]